MIKEIIYGEYHSTKMQFLKTALRLQVNLSGRTVSVIKEEYSTPPGHQDPDKKPMAVSFFPGLKECQEHPDCGLAVERFKALGFKVMSEMEGNPYCTITQDDSGSAQYNETVLTVTGNLQTKTIEITHKHEFTLTDPLSHLVLQNSKPIPYSEGLNQCKAHPGCASFLNKLKAQGFKID